MIMQYYVHSQGSCEDENEEMKQRDSHCPV